MICWRLELVEREPGFLEQNIKLVRQEVSTIASQLQKVVLIVLIHVSLGYISAVLMENSKHLYVYVQSTAKEARTQFLNRSDGVPVRTIKSLKLSFLPVPGLRMRHQLCTLQSNREYILCTSHNWNRYVSTSVVDPNPDPGGQKWEWPKEKS